MGVRVRAKGGGRRHLTLEHGGRRQKQTVWVVTAMEEELAKDGVAEIE